MGSIFKHQHPTLLFRFPKLIYFSYGLNWLIRLRKWYIHAALLPLIRSTKKPSYVLDAGVGDGQFIIPYAKKCSGINFIGVDISESNIAIIRALCKSEELTNITALYSNILDCDLPAKVQVLLCISMLQYIDDDIAVLKKLYRLADDKATLLLYVPINEKFITKLYAHLFNTLPNYETINNRKRIYSEKEIIEKVEQSGFHISQTKFTYGFWGILSHELMNSLFLLIIHSNILLKIISLLLLPILLPFIWVFMLVDYFQEKKTGNGLLIIAEKL
ncbi:MAG: methyltransferase domain-containing protein [Chitinophagaceae bacterium]|nr:methyltransferase domain-containing protein [Chitinophagaceae bacterium]